MGNQSIKITTVKLNHTTSVKSPTTQNGSKARDTSTKVSAKTDKPSKASMKLISVEQRSMSKSVLVDPLNKPTLKMSPKKILAFSRIAGNPSQPPMNRVIALKMLADRFQEATGVEKQQIGLELKKYAGMHPTKCIPEVRNLAAKALGRK